MEEAWLYDGGFLRVPELPLRGGSWPEGDKRGGEEKKVNILLFWYYSSQSHTPKPIMCYSLID